MSLHTIWKRRLRASSSDHVYVSQMRSHWLVYQWTDIEGEVHVEDPFVLACSLSHNVIGAINSRSLFSNIVVCEACKLLAGLYE